MIYNCIIKNVEVFDEYQGYLFIEINKLTLSCLFYGDEAFIKKYLQKGESIDIDLWLLDGVLKNTDNSKKEVLLEKGKTFGSIIDHTPKSKYYRIKCNDFLIDIENVDESDIESSHFKLGDKIEYEGTLQAFFPKTRYSFETVWNFK